MPGTRSARRVISTAMGIAAIFDPTGTAVYRGMRPVVPPGRYPPDGTQSSPASQNATASLGTPQTPVAQNSSASREGSQDPFESAMSTIMTAHLEAVVRAHDESGVTLVA
jgi:hypothetical protein